ncbi:MAG: pyroglutamyl-peptidase I [Actinobacteria bacterium]|nr:pyroglutamyl-peptidase I [Actinomycetota bacterium]MCG2798437.1 pyroglutamyl-peptidase I [Cellulomonas sp.]
MDPTVLLTGFAPFDGQQENASWLAVRRVADRWSGPGVLATALLPVSFEGVGPALDRAIDAHRPDLVICTGLAEGRARIGLERTAVNVMDARIPDQDGWSPIDEPVVPGGPVAYWSTLPIKACQEAVAAAGVPAEISNSAGTYVCNAVFYRLMHRVHRTAGTRAGFLHVPQATETARSPGPTLPLGTIADGLELIAQTSLVVAQDIRVTGGATH